MPGLSDLKKSAAAYVYDGSLAGFYCCVYESVYAKEMPAAIFPEEEWQPSLFGVKRILSDQEEAKRVRASIPEKISPRALELAENVFLSCLREKELHILRFLLKGYGAGSKVVNMLGDPVVQPLLKAEGHIFREAELLLGFVRFSDFEGALAGVISPKNFILPFIANHFVSRYGCEKFMIYDKTHKAALIYENGKRRIISVEHVELPPVSQEEELYQDLWKQFYNTIAIESRYNPKCRMTHMPKRYWENMLEVKNLL